MRRLYGLAAVAAFCFLVGPPPCRAEEPTTARTDPTLPDAPGPFHGFNVTGKYKDHYHSQVSEFGLEPLVMLFTRETDFSDPLKDLLKQINNAVDKNPTARLHPFLVVQSDDLPEVIGVDADPAVASKDDDKRIELEKKLGDAADALMIPHVDIILVGKTDLANDKTNYKVDADSFAFFLIQRDKVTARRDVKTGESLDDALVKDIMQVLADKGRATRK